MGCVCGVCVLTNALPKKKKPCRRGRVYFRSRCSRCQCGLTLHLPLRGAVGAPALEPLS